MADIVTKLKTAAFVASAAALVAACGEKAAETNIDVTTEEAAPAAEDAMPSGEAAMEAAPAEAAAVEGTAEEATAAEDIGASKDTPAAQ